MSLSDAEKVDALRKVWRLLDEATELRRRRAPYGWRDAEAKAICDAINELANVLRAVID